MTKKSHRAYSDQHLTSAVLTVYLKHAGLGNHLRSSEQVADVARLQRQLDRHGGEGREPTEYAAFLVQQLPWLESIGQQLRIMNGRHRVAEMPSIFSEADRNHGVKQTVQPMPPKTPPVAAPTAPLTRGPRLKAPQRSPYPTCPF